MAGRDEWFAIFASGPVEKSLTKSGATSQGGGNFSVDPAAAPAMRAGFERAIQQMRLARGVMRDMQYLGDEKVNPVVDKFVAALQEVGYGDEGSVTMAADSAFAVYQSVIDQLDRAMSGYQGDDHGAARLFKQQS